MNKTELGILALILTGLALPARVEASLGRVIEAGAPVAEITAPSEPALVWPLAGADESSITQGFGEEHHGIDLIGPMESAVLATADGVVRYAGPFGEGFGNLVVIDHNDGLSSWYAHLERVEVENGQTVTAGQALGVMGSTGNVTGPHLHFELRRDNVCQDPLELLSARPG